MMEDNNAEGMVRCILETRKDFYQKYMGKGLDFTKKYLSEFTGIKKFFAEYGISKKSDEYIGAKQALEEMLSK